MRNEWQKCPVCDGTGLVSRPPWLAGDVMEWAATSIAPYPCKACGGSGLLVRPSSESNWEVVWPYKPNLTSEGAIGGG